jgi:hypothetical protein
MRFNPVPLIAVLLLLSFSSSAQDDDRYRISLKGGSFIPEKNISDTSITALNRSENIGSRKSFVIIQFEGIPSEKEKQQLKLDGIELLDYVPNNAYTATITGSLKATTLSRGKARAIIELTPEQKMQPSLASGSFLDWAVKAAGTVDVWVSFPGTFSYEIISTEIKSRNFDIVSTEYKSYHIIGLRVAVSRLKELAALPFIEYVQTAPREDEPINDKSRGNSRANILNSSLPGGRDLTGEGVVVGVGDDSDPTRHIDFTGRLINRAANIGGSHGLHVMGTLGGAGNRQEYLAGYAPGVTMIAQRFSDIFKYAPAYVQDHGMVITNNSYGNVENDCAMFGIYDLYSRILDQQAFQLPNLQHVFAAGNSGTYNCSPYLPGFSTVLGAYQTAKNTIGVGNTDETGLIAANSSKGPVRDGRIKPEIVAQGVSVLSTTPTNIYGYSNGTSMAAPAISGGLALLYQRYKQLNAEVNPKNGLMKTLLCNGATDLGNAGPDFSYGFGWMNLLRSVKMLENNNYFTATVNSGATNTHSITIPPGVSIAQLKVMLYWNDSAAAALAGSALVNDLDLTVTDPSALIHLPQVLNTAPASVNAPATTGADHINNIEQVVINNPVAGTYAFSVTGTTIPFSGQHEYFLVFDTIPVSTTLTYPVGDEHLQAGEAVYIQWESYGNPTNDFTIQYSTDDGASWVNVVNGANIAANLRQLLWVIPAGTTNQAKIKIIHNGTGIESISEPFTIIGVPNVTLPAVLQCEGYIGLRWGSIPGATDFEIMQLQGSEMVSIGTTTDTTYSISGLSKDSVYWVSVRARINGRSGRRSNAVTRQPITGNCGGTISDKDLKIDAIISPVSSGRKFTSTELPPGASITIRVENLDNAPTAGSIPVTYILGTNPPVTELMAVTIPSRASRDYTFTTLVDMSAVGTYDLKVSVSYPGDPVSNNDTLVKTFKQLDNPFVDLTTGFLDDIESAAIQAHTNPQVGLIGLDRYDFTRSTATGQVRTFINSGMAYSGSKAFTLDADRYTAAGNSDSLTATFNMLGYDTTTDNIRLDFMYKHHGQVSHPANKVWMRGDDLKPWVEVYDLYANQADAGLFRRSASIELDFELAAALQNFSSSLQVRWGQWGQLNATTDEEGAGYTFDDIRLYRVANDLQLISIDSPTIASCGLDNTVPIRITIRNSAGSLITAIPVTFQVDGNAPVTETITAIAGNATISFTFSATADLSSPGFHTIKVWADLASDSFHDNDTSSVTLYNAPVITSFPHLQNFEISNGSWHTDGKRTSWQYGTPASLKISKAASGTKAWKTNLVGDYNNLEKSYLYSPCYDLTTMTKPMLSFSVALDFEDCGVDTCDVVYAEYSADGKNWSRLGASGSGTNWYNKDYAGNHVWSIQNYTRWHVATIPLPQTIDLLRLRFVMESDPAVTREGIAIDDIHIYDSLYNIYNGPPYTSAVSNQATVNGNNWIDFVSGGKIIASVNPNGQNMGSTDVQAYIHTGPARTNTGQYYHNRNITIKPATVNLTDSATVRFYFLDTETESLINATGCTGCSKPAMAYELGVTKYSDASDALENGSLGDNAAGDYLFITPVNVVKVPFDKGYYAEFKVKDFSEFWLNNGGPGNNQALPVELLSFTVNKNAGNEVLAAWITASENNTAHFELELARGNEEYRQNRFVKIGEVISQGNSSTDQRYQFADAESNKQGVRYYRLKIVDIDGRFTYSHVRAIVFEEEITWQVFPNPSHGIFNLVYQANDGQIVNIKIHDMAGKLVHQVRATANAFVQKLAIDLRGTQFSAGMYLLEVATDGKKEVFRLLKK